MPGSAKQEVSVGLLDQLLGSPPTQQHQDYQDFINRYQQGSPSQGYSDQEVLTATSRWHRS